MAKNQMTGSTVMSRAERAKIADQQKLRAAIRAKAAASGITPPKSAVDNFVSTYSKTKVGPIQRAVAKFFTKIRNTYKTSREDSKPTRPRPSKTSDQARDEARVVANQRRLAKKSASQGGGSVLSNKKKTKTSDQARDEARVVDRQLKLKAKSDSQGGGSVLSNKKKDKPTSTTRPTPPPSRPKTNKKTTKPTPKPKLYTTISVQTGKPVDKKVTAAQHLANLDARKAFLKKRKAAASKIEATLKKGKK